MKHNEANVMNDKIFEILWKKKIPSIPSLALFWRFSIIVFVAVFKNTWKKTTFIKDKEILIKRKCHQAAMMWFSFLVCHVEGIWAFDWNITEWSFSFWRKGPCCVIFGRVSFYREIWNVRKKMFSWSFKNLFDLKRQIDFPRFVNFPVSNFYRALSHATFDVILYVFIRSFKTRQLVLTCALVDDVHARLLRLSDLKTIIVIHSRSHYEMRRGSWRNLDLEKYSFILLGVHCRRKNNLIELNWSQRLNAAAFDKTERVSN